MATIRKRDGKNGSSYQVQIRIKDGGIESASFKSLTKAKIWAQSVEASIRDGKHFTKNAAKKHTLSDLIERFLDHPSLKDKTKLNYGPQLKWWISQLGDNKLADITPDKISRLRDGLLKKGFQKSSTNRYIAALSSAYSMAVKEFGWIDINPCSRVRKLSEPRGRTRFLTDDERERLLNSCEESNTKELLIIVLLALSTGARKNEIRWLRWDDVNIQTGTVIFRETMNGTIRSVPIVGRGLDLMREWGKIRRLDTDLVFPGRNPKHPVLFEKSWKRALKESNIEDFRFHDLRHSAASYLIMAGVHMRTVAEILGHKTFAMVQRYSHLSPEHLRGELTRTMESVNL